MDRNNGLRRLSEGVLVKMAESAAVISGEASNAATQGSVVAQPKFIFGQNMCDRIKNVSQSVPSSESSSRENSPKPSEKTDSDVESETTTKRPADFDDNKQESSEEGSPRQVQHDAKRLKADDDDEPKPFKLKPSILNEVAKNLAGSAKGEPRALTSPIPKTFGLSTSEASSTETRTGATSPDPLGNNKSQNYFQMFLNKQNDNADGPSGSGGFVFGRNMGERVVITSEDSIKPENAEEGSTSCSEVSETQKSNSPSKGNYIGPKTLAEVAAEVDAQGTKFSSDKPHLTLAEAAQVYQETASPHNKSHLAKVTIITGEEEERNILQINCRLFLFDVSKHFWKEKGRGTLRLNDMCESMSESILQSRLVMRTQGNLKVVLNTKLWPEMTLGRGNERSLRITAMDAIDNDIKIFLIMGGPKDIDHLFTAIDDRLRTLKRCPQEHSEEHVGNSHADPPEPNDMEKVEEGVANDRSTDGVSPLESSSDSCSGPMESNATSKEVISDDE